MDESNEPIAPLETGAPPVEPPPVVSSDRYCVRCGYLLRGLSPVGRCPECGTDVALSLREPTLATASDEYLRSLRRGLSLVLNSILIMIVGFLASMVVGATLGPASPWVWVMQAISLFVTAAMFWGYWLFTQPDPGQVAAEAQNAARRVVRASVFVLAATTVLQLVLAVVSPPMPTPGGMPAGADLLENLVSLAGLIAWGVQFFATMRYTRWLAGRVPDQFIVRRTRTYMWVLPVVSVGGCILVFLGPLIALILYWNLLDRLRKHVRSIIDHGEPAKLPKMVA